MTVREILLGCHSPIADPMASIVHSTANIISMAFITSPLSGKVPRNLGRNWAVGYRLALNYRRRP